MWDVLVDSTFDLHVRDVAWGQWINKNIHQGGGNLKKRINEKSGVVQGKNHSNCFVQMFVFIYQRTITYFFKVI